MACRHNGHLDAVLGVESKGLLVDVDDEHLPCVASRVRMYARARMYCICVRVRMRGRGRGRGRVCVCASVCACVGGAVCVCVCVRVGVGVRVVWVGAVGVVDLAEVAVERVKILTVEALGEGGRVAVEPVPDEPGG